MEHQHLPPETTPSLLLLQLRASPIWTLLAAAPGEIPPVRQPSDPRLFSLHYSRLCTQSSIKTRVPTHLLLDVRASGGVSTVPLLALEIFQHMLRSGGLQGTHHLPASCPFRACCLPSLAALHQGLSWPRAFLSILGLECPLSSS